MARKELIKSFWERNPCGAVHVAALEEGSRAFFDRIERMRYEGDDFMWDVVGFERWRGKTVLEAGCGLGTDLLQFARNGAKVYGVDLTEKGARLARQRLATYGVAGVVLVADGESLPFPDGHFDLVYSWGVVHHTACPSTMTQELIRVTKPGGTLLAMVYQRRSLLALQIWLRYGLLRGRPWRSPAQLIAAHLESPGTQAYTREEARALFRGLRDIQIRTIVTRYDARIGRRVFLPRWVRGLIPPRWGWFMVVRGVAQP